MSKAPRPDPAAVRGTRLPSLTGLRFIAAAMVFLHHGIWVNLFADTGFAGLYHDLFINAGHVGVSFFFVLSGFVLTMAQRSGDTLRGFWRRRLVKVYPNHVVGFLVALVVIGQSVQWNQVLPNLFLVHSWVPSYDVLFSANPPSWSLACEAFFYFAFPWLARWIGRIRADRLWWWAGGIVAAVVLVAVAAQVLLPATPGMADGQPIGLYQFWAVYALPPVRALDFVLGIVMARIVLSGRWIAIGPLTAVIAFVAAYALAMRLPYVYGLDAATLVPLALIVPAVAAGDLAGKRTVLHSRPAIWLGEISFAFYLLHVPLLIWLRARLGTRLFDTPQALALLLLGLAITVVASWLLHTLVEQPMMRRFSRPRRTAPPAPDAPAPALAAAHDSGR
ncbi:acyltransferase family protein [Kitasatospora sp. NPDC058032]|uniref:acyltransferase family protein n=1 Tax=Kitasatospora sp. NPDC058032 TaxID=3346307 RepID=UPI0036D95DB3